MPTIYPSLAIGAARRLALFKKEAAQPNWVRPLTWRDVRFANLKSHMGLAPGSDGWYVHGPEQFRGEKDAHEIIRSLPRGWYTDCDARETAVGIVARLPHGRFIAGYRWTYNGERAYFPDIFTDEDEAARAADSHAERFSETAREDSERYNAMALAELDVETKTEELEKAFILRHRSKFGGKPRVIRCIENLRQAREELRDATAAYERG